MHGVVLHLVTSAVPAQDWRFDIWSALIGVAVAVILGALIYVYRASLRQVWDALGAVLGRLRHFFQASVEDVYRERVIAHTRGLVTPSHVAPLDALFVEPWLIPPPTSPESVPEIGAGLTRPEALPLHAAFGDHPYLALLGGSGTGRTMVLGYLAVSCASASSQAADESSMLPGLDSLRERLPLYVDLTGLDWGGVEEPGAPESLNNDESTDREQGERVDAVEWLLTSAVATVGGSSRLLGPLRRYFAAGRAIILVDGWEDLSAGARQAATARLSEAIRATPGNICCVVAGERGYGPLVDTGLVPLRMAPWQPSQLDALADHWSQAVSEDGEVDLTASRPLHLLLRRAAHWGAGPMALALRAFVYLSEREEALPRRQGALFERAADLLLWQPEAPWVLATCRMALGQLASQLLRAGSATMERNDIDAAIEAGLPPSDDGPTRAASVAFRALTGERGMLRPVSHGRYAFAHPLWLAHFAARQSTAVASSGLVERLDDPRWAAMFDFYAEYGDIGPLVAAWMRQLDDLSHHRMRTLARWIRVAPDGAVWREKAMAILARAFLKPYIPRSIRLALAEDLALTGMPGVPYFLGQQLDSPSGEMRLAALTGLARVAGESELGMFEKARDDEDQEVCRTCILSLAALDLSAATRLLADWLVSVEEDALRPEIAEALAGCGQEGHALLREAAILDNVMVRRAAVFGLGAAGDLGELDRLAREDGQWIVRSAAAAVLAELDAGDRVVSGVPSLPEVDQLPWLISWAAGRGEGVGRGDAARTMLLRALDEGDAPVQLAALSTLAVVGCPDDLNAIKPILESPDPVLASAAFDVLAEISRRYDLVIAV